MAKFNSAPTLQHWSAAKRVLRYIKGTLNLGLYYSKSSTRLTGYCDADYAGDPNDRRSCSGYIFMMSSGPVSWCSRKQTCVALSTAEAEYISLANASQEAVWLNRVVGELSNESSEPITIMEDNSAAIAIASNDIISNKSKHVDVKFHFVRDLINENSIKVQ